MAAVDAKAINIYMSVTGPYAAQMARNGAATQAFGNQAHAGMTKAATGVSRFGAVANKIGMVAAVAIAAGLALSAKAAIDFESSFAGVRKTVDASESGFRKLADGVRQMAVEIPIGVNELNRIMELGGQLGVDKGGLLAFTETIAKIGVATDLTTESASMGFARLDNIMQLNNNSFDRMGATVVDLGNNFAATEDEILTFALRIAPMGNTVGMSTDEILGLATAFTSVGIPAERGGTAVQKTLIKMSDAAADGGPKLEAFAQIAGVSSDEFAKMFKADPALALQTFITGLGDFIDAGGNTVPVFKAMELSNQRVVQSLLAMANAEEVLVDALDTGDRAWEDNIALTEEAEKRFETVASQLALVKNKVVDLGISIGADLLPWILDLAEGFSVVLNWIDNLDGGIKSVILAIAGMTAAMWLAVSHPIILALAVVAGGIAWIGHNANVAKERVKTLKEVLESGMATDLNLDKIFGESVIDEWLLAGFTTKDISDAFTGTQAEYEKFVDELAAYKRSVADTDAGLSIAGTDIDAELLGAYRDELQGIAAEEDGIIAARNRAKILGVTNLHGMDEERARTDKAREAVESLYHARQGLIEQDVAPLVGAVLDQDALDGISDAVGTYNETIADAFAEVDSAVRDQIDLWYEFDDNLEIAWDEIIKTLARQITAVGTFEDVLSQLDLRADVENFIRTSFNTPALMEAFNRFYAAGGEDFGVFIDGIIREQDRLGSTIQAKWKGLLDGVEFTSGTQLLNDLAAVAQEVLDNPEDNIYSPVEVWLGLAEAAIAAADEHGIAEDVAGWLLRAFSDDGSLRSSVDMTQEMIDELLAKLRELEGDYTVNVNTNWRTTGDPIYGAPTSTVSSWTNPDRRSAFGGNVMANEPQWTGELGPELFVPFNNGTIIPNKDLKSGGDRTTNIYIERAESNDLPGDISEGLTRASITEQVDMIGAY